MSATVQEFEDSLALPFSGIGMKFHFMETSIHWNSIPIFKLNSKIQFTGNEIFSPVATAEFSKFAGVLSAALSQHHIFGFEIAQLEFHHLH